MSQPDNHHHHTEEELRRELAEQERVDADLAAELRTGERREGELTEDLRELEERGQVEAEVTFPLAQNSPFRERVSRDDTARQVLTAAMQYFTVKDDQTTRYELYFRGSLVAGLDETLGRLDEHAHEVKFTLSKTLING